MYAALNDGLRRHCGLARRDDLPHHMPAVVVDQEHASPASDGGLPGRLDDEKLGHSPRHLPPLAKDANGCLDAIRTENPRLQRCRTTRRPRKPDPPKTVTMRIVHGRRGSNSPAYVELSRPCCSGHLNSTATDHHLSPGLPRTDWDRSRPSTDRSDPTPSGIPAIDEPIARDRDSAIGRS